MDLRFKIKNFSPPKDFFGDFPEENHWLSSRFKVNVKFKSIQDWDKNYNGFLFDTGAYVSIAPDYILEFLKIKPEYVGFVHGIIDKKECKMKTKVANITFKLIDNDGKESSELQGWFAFHSLNIGPLLLGMNGIFQKLGITKEPDSDQITLKTA